MFIAIIYSGYEISLTAEDNSSLWKRSKELNEIDISSSNYKKILTIINIIVKSVDSNSDSNKIIV